MADIRSMIIQFYADVDDPSKTKTDLAASFSDDFKDHDRHPLAPKSQSDKDAHLSFFDELKNGFSDFSHTLNLVEETQSGKYLVYWSFEGTHSGTFYGLPASNKRARCNGIDIYSCAGEKFLEQRHVEDVAGLMAQLTAT